MENEGIHGNLGTEMMPTEQLENRITFIRETVNFDNNLLGEDGKDLKLKQKEQEQRLRSSMLRSRLKSSSSNLNQDICRICLSEEEVTNRLISPCSCTGSMKHIHVDCLKEWLEGKKHMKETDYVNSYIWKNLECEICKTPYSDQATLKNGHTISLLNYTIHSDATSYMIIESVTNTTSKTIHVINFN